MRCESRHWGFYITTGGMELISEEQLDKFRVSGETIRVVRDGMEVNDVHGIVVAWDESSVVIRRPNRRVVKLSRIYSYAPVSEERVNPLEDTEPNHS